MLAPLSRFPRARGGASALLIVVALSLAGCVSSEPAPVASTAASTTVSPTPAAGLVADGSAADNLAYFTSVMNDVASTDAAAQGRAYVDALVEAGFDKTAMQVTPDRTTVDNPADSIQFSVAFNGECLVGQVGPSTKTPTALVMPLLADGSCLIGKTRAIDW